MQVMSFAFIKDEDGAIKTLPPESADVLALLEAHGILGRKWRSLVRFIREEMKKIDFVVKLYYPIFLISEGNSVAFLDGLALNTMRVCDYLEVQEDRDCCNMRTTDFPIIDIKKYPNLSQARFISSEREINDGYAVPPSFEKKVVASIAESFFSTYRNSQKHIAEIKEELERIESRFKEEASALDLWLKEQQKALDEKIAEKNTEIERIGKKANEDALMILRKEFQLKNLELKKKKEALQNSLSEMRSKLYATRAKVIDLQSKMGAKERELSKVKVVLSKLVDKKEALSGDNLRAMELKDILMKIEELKESIDRNEREVAEYLKALSGLKEEEKLKEIAVSELEKEMDKATQEERLLPTKEDIESKKIQDRFEKERSVIIGELYSLISKKEKLQHEKKVKEAKLVRERERLKTRYLEILKKVQNQVAEIERAIIKKNGFEAKEAEMLYIPFYLYSKDKEIRVFKPPVTIKKGGNVEAEDKMDFMDGFIDYLQTSWEIVSLIIYESGGLFDLLHISNRERVKKGIESLRGHKAINKIQISILMSGGIF
ncbi:MAG: hypothetical protein NO516_04005 [Candidatus Methanomethylicia archaeon]|nr:hypothetical protein [Candidatus Methanomethylicia archaeon]